MTVCIIKETWTTVKDINHRLWTGESELGLSFCATFEIAREFAFANILPGNFATFPHVFHCKFELESVRINCYTSPSHFFFDKQRNAHNIKENGGKIWMWPTISCKWRGCVIALRCMALLYLTSHLRAVSVLSWLTGWECTTSQMTLVSLKFGVEGQLCNERTKRQCGHQKNLPKNNWLHWLQWHVHIIIRRLRPVVVIGWQSRIQ